MRSFLFVILLCLLACGGCSRAAPKKANEANRADFDERKIERPNEPDKSFAVLHAAREIDEPPGQAKAPAKQVKEAKDAKPRKIRYTADINLIVTDLDKAEADLDDARKEAKGEYAKVEINSSANAVRSGTWRIRVPVEKLDSFRKAVAKLGEVTKNTLDSDDMTGQYYDLLADIENRKSAREALRDLLKETGKKEMKHYLEVWDKLESVNGEINRKEGQLKLWADLTDLTTVTVSLREKQKFLAAKPPDPAEVPTFRMRASKTWEESWEAFVSFLQWLAIAAIAVTPWLPIPLLFVSAVWLIARRMFRVVNAASPKKA